MGNAVAAAEVWQATPDADRLPAPPGLRLRRTAADTVPAPGFRWALAGGTALVVAALVSLVLVWRRRHPAFA